MLISRVPLPPNALVTIDFNNHEQMACVTHVTDTVAVVCALTKDGPVYETLVYSAGNQPVITYRKPDFRERMMVRKVLLADLRACPNKDQQLTIWLGLEAILPAALKATELEAINKLKVRILLGLQPDELLESTSFVVRFDEQLQDAKNQRIHSIVRRPSPLALRARAYFGSGTAAATA